MPPLVPKEEAEVMVITITDAKTNYNVNSDADPDDEHGPWLDGLFAIDMDDTHDDGAFGGATIKAQTKLKQVSSFKDESEGKLVFDAKGYQEFEMTGYLNLNVADATVETNVKAYIKRIKNR